ncbi:unnamed protein product [Oppiella nova]|uniref:Uncharacterized protein n=1 Tax=Oppiella nova TaxID=334625 RepID=A0A7R9LQH1_9ACAR|nr:unnamed protein product [Oppiella nova]CAG2165974.1 unnamed protein product [Oppiella nova]
MDKFIGKFVETSCENLEAFTKVYNGKPGDDDDEAVGAVPVVRVLEFSKSGSIYTNKVTVGPKVVETTFELDKEFVVNLPDGTTTQAVMRFDGNRLVETRRGANDIEIETRFEIQGNEIRVTSTMGSAAMIVTFARQ